MKPYTIGDYNAMEPHSTWYDEERETFRCEQCGYEIRLNDSTPTIVEKGRQVLLELPNGCVVLVPFKHRGSMGGLRITGMQVCR